MIGQTVHEIITYSSTLYRYDRRRFSALIVLMSALGVFEGINIVLIAPLLTELGVGTPTGITLGVSRAFAMVGLPLNIYSLLSCYVLVIVGQSLLQRQQVMLSARLQRGFGRMLSNRLFKAATEARWRFWLDNRKSDITHYLTDEVSRVITGTVYFAQITSALIIALVQIILALFISPELTAIAAFAGVILYFASLGTVRRSKKLGWDLSKVYRRFHAECQEYLNGIKEIKAYNNERRFTAEFAQLGRDVDEKLIAFNAAQSNAALYSKVSSSLMIVVFLFVAAKLLPVNSEYLLLMLYVFSRLWPQFASIQNNLHYVIMMLPSFASINQFIIQAEMNREAGAVATTRLASIDRSLELCDVSFSYGDNRNILTAINLSIVANTTVGIVGESGSGKSTLADLLIGLHLPDVGKIYVDGRPLEQNFIPVWRNSLAYVSQDSFLLNDTIKNNLLWSQPDADEAAVKLALQQAACDFVYSLPDGIESVVGDRGVKLSGGERQRIVLARALLRKPAFLLLDEATSALDNENEQKIKKSLDELRGKLTVLVIAHRLTTVENVDLIVVLDKGEIVERGRYADLVADQSGRLYRMVNQNR